MPIRTDRRSLTAPASTAGASPSTGRRIGPTAAVAATTTTPGLTSALGIAPATAVDLASHSKPGRLPGPLNFILDLASATNRSVADAIQHPLHAIPGNAKAPGIRELMAHPEKHPYISQVLNEKGALNWVPKAYGLRTAAGFASDIFLDPSTYITFGAGAGLNAVSKSAGRAAAFQAIELAAKDGQVPLHLVARAAVEDALAQTLAPKTLKANIRVPFSRSKDINIFETGIAHRVGAAAKGRLPETVSADTPAFIKQVIGTDRGINRLAYAAYQDTRRVASPLEHDVKTQAGHLNEVIAQAAKDAGLSRKQADEMLWWHAQSPATHAIPEALQPALEAAKTLFAQVEHADIQAGVLTRDRLLENYLPHLADSQKGNRVLRSVYAQRSTDKLYDPFFTQERLAKTPEAFKKAGEQHGFTPEHNLAKLFEARAKASIRARQFRAVSDALKNVEGYKPPPHSTVAARAAFEEAKAGAAEARAKLDAVMAPRPTAAIHAETKAAQEELRAAKADYERLLALGVNTHGIRAAKYRLMLAERKAAGQKAYALRAAQEQALPEFQRLMASARATGARLPKPTGAKITMPADLKVLSSKLRRFRTKIKGEAKKLRDSVAPDLRAEAKRRRDSYRPSLQDTKSKRSVKGPGLHHSHSQNFDSNQGRMKFNGGNENSGVHYRTKAEGGGRKNLTDYENDYIAELAMRVERNGIGDLPPNERVIYEATQQANELNMLAYEIDSAFQHASGGAFGELDANAGLTRLRELADSLVGSTVTRDMRAQRTRAAGGLPQAQGLEAVSPRAQAAIERYFTGPANTLRNRAEEVRTGAEADVVAAIRNADAQVARAKRAVEKVSKGPNPAIRKEARRRLVRAQADARNARLALERARAGYEGNPREVLSAFRGMLKAAEAEKTAGKKLGALERANMLLELRPGRPTTPEEWQALQDGWTLVGSGSELARGVKLPTDVAAGINEVHKLISPILSDDPMRVAGRFIAGFTSRWKVLALLSPGYHVRNQIDDGIRAFMAGARNPRSFAQAARILKGGIHEASETATIRIGKKTYTHAEYLRRARAYGVIDAGFVRTEVMSSGQSDISKTFWGMHTPGRGRTSQLSSHVGNYRENVNRLGTFIELEKSGRSPLVAARRTREFLIDYGEVGRFVDAARKFVFPFITYPSKVIPIYARELARHPGFYAHLGALENTLNQAAGNPDLTQLQAYNRSSFAVPLPGAVRSLLGVSPGSAAIVNPNGLLGVGSLDMLDPHKNALVSNIGGSLLNPMLRVPIEIGTQRSLYFNSNLSRLATAPQFLKWAHDAGIPVPTYVPPGGNGSERGKTDYTGKAVPGYSSYMAELLGMLPVYSQSSRVTSPDSASRANALAKILFGIPISSYDATRQAGYAATHQRG